MYVLVCMWLMYVVKPPISLALCKNWRLKRFNCKTEFHLDAKYWSYSNSSIKLVHKRVVYMYVTYMYIHVVCVHTVCTCTKKRLLIFTEMGAISDGLATFIDYIAEHVSPRIAGRWDVQETWCNRYSVAQVRHITLGRATRAFANHFFSRLRCSIIHQRIISWSLHLPLHPTEPMNHGCGSRRE